METRFFNVLRRLVRGQNHVDHALVADATWIPEFLRVRVTPDMRREAIKRLDDLERNPRPASAQRVDNAGNNVICYLTADGAVFGPIGSNFRVRTRKLGQTLRANDLLDPDEKA